MNLICCAVVEIVTLLLSCLPEERQLSNGPWLMQLTLKLAVCVHSCESFPVVHMHCWKWPRSCAMLSCQAATLAFCAFWMVCAFD